MAFRSFVDATGREWHVYDVVPPSDERRRNDRRGDPTPPVAHEAVDGDGDQYTRERRDSSDRRLSVGRVSRLSLAQPDGWLAFESESERRRLSPIPDDWMRCNDEALEAYRQSARPVVSSPFGRTEGGVTERKS
jgi:hypothetical protein